MTTEEENEQMLKVIEGKSTWSEVVQDMVPLFYSLAIANVALNITYGSIAHGKLDNNSDCNNSPCNS